MKVGILGGTFNPPHNGHLWAAKEAKKQLGLDRIIFIPTGVPPHKKMPAGSATAQQRLDMTRLAAKELPGAQVSEREIRRKGTSYTALTIAELTAENPDDEFYFIMGTDMLLTFDLWYHPQEIADLCNLVVVTRHENDGQAIEQKAHQLRQRFGARVCVIRCIPVDVSSTEIRENFSYNVPKSVYAYIKTHHLYQTEKDETEEKTCFTMKKPGKTF